MIDILTSFAVIAGAYIGSVGFTFLLFKLFFPLKTKSVSEKVSFAFTRNNISPASKGKMHLLSVNGRRRAWVKVSS